MTGPRPRLLLLDDDAGGRLVLAALLEDEGFEVIEAASLGEGRSALDQGDFRLVLLDLNLPDGLGTELVEVARKHHPDAAIALLSGEDGALEGSPLPRIAKGGDPADLLVTIRKLGNGGPP